MLCRMWLAGTRQHAGRHTGDQPKWQASAGRTADLLPLTRCAVFSVSGDEVCSGKPAMVCRSTCRVSSADQNQEAVVSWEMICSSPTPSKRSHNCLLEGEFRSPQRCFAKAASRRDAAAFLWGPIVLPEATVVCGACGGAWPRSGSPWGRLLTCIRGTRRCLVCLTSARFWNHCADHVFVLLVVDVRLGRTF